MNPYGLLVDYSTPGAGSDQRCDLLSDTEISNPVHDQLVSVAGEHECSASAVLPALHSESRLESDRHDVWIPFPRVHDQQTAIGERHCAIGSEESALDDSFDPLTFFEAAGQHHEGGLSCLAARIGESPYAATKAGGVGEPWP